MTPSEQSENSARRPVAAVLLKVCFFGALAAGLFLALFPRYRCIFHDIWPKPVRTWLNESDDAVNVIAFFVLASIGLRMQRLMAEGKRPRSRVTALMASPAAMVAGLMLLVCGIEFVQIFVPERVGDIQDVCTGWSGIFSAWLAFFLRDGRTARFGGGE